MCEEIGSSESQANAYVSRQARYWFEGAPDVFLVSAEELYRMKIHTWEPGRSGTQEVEVVGVRRRVTAYVYDLEEPTRGPPRSWRFPAAWRRHVYDLEEPTRGPLRTVAIGTHKHALESGIAYMQDYIFGHKRGYNAK
jgi:hypothetical protein